MVLKVIQSSIIKDVKKIGVCVKAPELCSDVVKWIQACSSSTSTGNPKMNDLNVILFDSHSDTMAKELLERNVKNLFLLEGSQIYSSKQKKAVWGLEDQYENSKISALYAPMKSILSPSKSVKVNVPLWNKFIGIDESLIKYRNYKIPERKKIVMFGCLPFPSQQRQLLSSLLEQLLVYYDSSKEVTKNTKHASSYFQFGTFSLITFLHASHFTRLISAQLDAPELTFYGQSHRSFSYLFNSLFEVQQLSNGIGFDLSMFDPEIPLTPIKSHLKHLLEHGYEENKLYPIKIEPRPVVQLPGDIKVPFKIPYFKEKGDYEKEVQKRKQIIEFAYWLLMTGKNPKQLKVTWDALGLSANGDTPPKNISEFSSVFPQIHQVLNNTFSAELNLFRRGLYKDKTDEKFVD